MSLLTKKNREIAFVIVFFMIINILAFPGSQTVYALGSPEITVSPINLSIGDTATVTAEGFPSNAGIHSVIVGDITGNTERFITQIRVNGTLYTYDGNEYKYKNGSNEITIDGSGNLTFSLVIPSGLLVTDNIVTIWTSGFTPETEAEASCNFTWNPVEEEEPSIATINPTLITRGGSVTITGINFGSDQGTIYFTPNGGEETTVASGSWSDTSITFIVPETAPIGNAALSIRTSAGDTSNSTNIRIIPFQPSILDITPNSGSAAGGRSITISGAEFIGVTSVKFGENEATSFSVVSQNEITAVSPPGNIGIVDVSVTTEGGTSNITVLTKFTYNEIVPPHLLFLNFPGPIEEITGPNAYPADPIQVAVCNQDGNIMTNRTDTINLIALNPNLPFLEEKNQVITRQAVNGIATFERLYLPFNAAGYSLLALDSTDSSVTSASSMEFPVTWTEYTSTINANVAVEEGVSIPELNSSVLTVWSENAQSGGMVAMNGTGNYSVGTLKPANDYKVSVITKDRDMLALQSGVTVTSGSTANVNLTAKPKSSLQVEVRNDGASPVRGVLVKVIDEGNPADAADDMVLAYDNTDSNGQIPSVVSVVPGTTYKVTAQPFGDMPYLLDGVSQTFTAAASDNSIVLTLPSIDAGSSSISGVVRNEEGRTIVGATVKALVEVDGRTWDYSATTDSNGQYSINNIYPGSFTLSTIAGAYQSDVITATVTNGEPLVQNFTLKPVERDISVKLFVVKKHAGEAAQQPYIMGFKEAMKYGLKAKGIDGYYAPIYQSGDYLIFRGLFDTGNLVLSLDATEDRLSSLSHTGALTGSSCETTITLEEYAEARGTLLDAQTARGINYWKGSLYRLESGSETWVRDFTSYSADFALSVPQSGTYILKAKVLDAVSEKSFIISSQGQILEIGNVSHSTSGIYAGKTGNESVAKQTNTVPGGEITINTFYKNSGTATNNTKMVLGIPSGASVVTGSVLLNKAAAADIDVSASTYTINIGHVDAGAEGIISYKLKLNDDYTGDFVTSTSRITYNNGGYDVTEIIGIAKTSVSQIYISSQQATKSRNVVITGQSQLDSEIKIFAEGSYPIARVNSGPTGYFKASVILPDMGESYSYRVSALSTVGETTFRSNTIKIDYDINNPVVTNVSIKYFNNWTGYGTYSFDPRQGQPTKFLSFQPAVPITVEVTFDNPERVSEANVLIPELGLVTAVKGEDSIFRATLLDPDKKSMPGDIYVGYSPKKLFSDFYTEDGSAVRPRAPLTEEQLRNVLPQRMSDFVAQDITASSTDAEDKLEGEISFPGAKVDVHFDMSIKKDLGGYEPSATDRAFVKETGIPIFGNKMDVAEENGKTIIRRSFYYFSNLADANTAMQQDPNPAKVVWEFIVENADELAEAGVDLGFFAESNVKPGGEALVKKDAASRIEAIFKKVSDAYQRGDITKEQYDKVMAATNKSLRDLEASTANFAMADVATTLCVESGYGAAGGLMTGTLTWGAQKLDDKYKDSDLLSIELELDGYIRQKQVDDAIGELQKYKEILDRDNAKYADVHKMLDPVVEAYKMQNNWILDPSGYVYEALPENRLEGVTATIMKQDQLTGEWKHWNAEYYEQSNPLTTDSTGFYAWDVPQGKYMVVYKKEGYRIAQSEIMEVPPPHFDVNIAMVSEKGAKVSTVIAALDGRSVEVAFDQYIQASSFYNIVDMIVVYDDGHNQVNGIVSPVNPVIDEKGLPLVKAVRFTPNSLLTIGNTYTVEIEKAIRNYNQQVMDSADDIITRTVTVPEIAQVPVITNVLNAYGATSGGTQVIIKGSGFTGTTAVNFGGVSATSFMVDSDSQIRATSPVGSGNAAITVVNPGGTSNSDKYFIYHLSAVPERFVFSVSPEKGAAAGGNVVTITGEGLSDATGVKFGTVPATSFTVISETQIRATVPVGAGKVKITVSTPYGDILAANAFYTYLESHIMPIGPTGGTLSKTDNSSSIYIPEGAFNSWQILSIDEIDAGTLQNKPTGYRVVGTAIKVDFGEGVTPEVAATLKLKYAPREVPEGYAKAIYKSGTWAVLETNFTGEQAVVDITSGGTYVVLAIPPSNSDSGAGGGNASPIPTQPSSNEETPTELIAIPKLNDSTGTAVADIGLDSINKLFNASESDNGIKSVEINVEKVEGAKAYEVTLPQSIITSNELTKNIVINTEIASVTIPENMLLNSISAQDKVSLVISAADTTSLGENLKEQIGTSPVIDIHLLADNKVVSWKNENTYITVNVPYTPKNDIKDSEYITVWYVDSQNNIIPVVNGRYDSTLKTVTFRTNHLSKYAVVYNKKSFDDIKTYNWAQKQIEVMASKGIINGRSANEYDPSAKITRAEYITLLVKTLELEANFKENFADIKANEYYYKEVGIAKELGIVEGIGNDAFDPNSNISRQDMMVMTYRALNKLGIIAGKSSTKVLNNFTDKNDISKYAIESTAKMIGEGLIEGDNNRIYPHDKLSRAEAAVIIYRIFYKQFEK